MLSLFTIEEIIGNGSYGTVYKVVHKHTKSVYAMKKVFLLRMTHYEKVNIINELRILATHRCPFIVKFKNAFVHDNYLYMVTEYASMGDLSHIIKKHKTACTHMSENKILTYFLQTCVAVSYLHNLNIIHRDLKPANIFIDKEDNVKLGDFGIVKLMRTFMMYGQTQIGTPLYMCPEIYKRERYDSKVDIWALGCILYELITLKPAFAASNILKLKENIFHGKIERIKPNTYSVDLIHTLNKMICVSPRQRPTIKLILNTRYINEQLAMRHLNLFDTYDVEPAFHINCAVPRISSDWQQVIEMLVSKNATIMLNKEEQQKIDNVNKAKNNIEDGINELSCITTEIHKLHSDIEKARKYIIERELIIKQLNDRKAILEHVIKNSHPPTTHTPNKMLRYNAR